MISEIERRVRILDYVRENSNIPNVTKSDVMRHMKEISRAMTTHKTIIELIKEGKIVMMKPKDKPYSQTDYLVINEENEFNKIYKILSNIQNLINESVRYMYAVPGVPTDPDGNPLMDVKEARILSEIHEDFRDNYIQSIILMIHIFYNKIELSNSTEKDQVILFRKLNTLNASLATNPWFEKSPDERLTFYTKNMERSFKMLSARINRKIPLGDKIIQTIENFKKEFLSESKAKTTQPREKSSQ